VTADKPWIFDILARHGIRYDSSIFPVGFHPDYAAAGGPLSIYAISDRIIEFPMSCFRKFGMTFPCSGGGYLRLFPYVYTAYGIRQCNREGRPAVIYLHPWEIDPDQPRVKGVAAIKRFRHYFNLDKTIVKLERLLDEFKFDTCASVLGLRQGSILPEQ
jgi:polysaccharide deacetylase family protein (PEP-CTERM system associated)